MDTLSPMIEFEAQGDTLILTPQRNLRELNYLEIEAEAIEAVGGCGSAA
jgi:hypothetical protein